MEAQKRGFQSRLRDLGRISKRNMPQSIRLGCRIKKTNLESYVHGGYGWRLPSSQHTVPLHALVAAELQHTPPCSSQQKAERGEEGCVLKFTCDMSTCISLASHLCILILRETENAAILLGSHMANYKPRCLLKRKGLKWALEEDQHCLPSCCRPGDLYPQYPMLLYLLQSGKHGAEGRWNQPVVIIVHIR